MAMWPPWLSQGTPRVTPLRSCRVWRVAHGAAGAPNPAPAPVAAHADAQRRRQELRPSHRAAGVLGELAG